VAHMSLRPGSLWMMAQMLRIRSGAASPSGETKVHPRKCSLPASLSSHSGQFQHRR
jgi:hypothetical protein